MISQKQAEGKGSVFRPGSNPNQRYVMAQADSNISISVDSTRRGFLARAAAVAAGGAAVGVALPLPASAGLIPDPILGLIEAHKAARAGVYSTTDVLHAVEEELTNEGVNIFDRRERDPRQMRCEEAISRALETETEAACALVSQSPTTMAGALALLAYANAADTDGEGWPSDLSADDTDTKTRSWHFFLIERLAADLPGLARMV
jgi:hypothetical protein